MREVVKKILICGTRKKGYKDLVIRKLNLELDSGDFEIVEGCCPDSADVYAEEWAKIFNIKVYHFPSTSGNYLRRNIEMVNLADEVIAFWDGFSYGTAHAIAQAILNKKKVEVIKI